MSINNGSGNNVKEIKSVHQTVVNKNMNMNIPPPIPEVPKINLQN